VSLLGAWTNLFTSVPLFESRLVGALERLPVVLFILSLLAGAAAWFGWTATVQLVAEFMGGRGRGVMLFSLVGFSYLPRVFAAPVAVVANLTGYDIQLPVHVALLLWSLYLTFLSVRHVHGLNRVRALSAVLLPGAALVGLAVLVVLSVAVFLLPFLGKLGNFPL
jgi:hypothetical protein